ncbi:alpha/beta fold hydrolase [Cellulomonas fengjieae]|uniref:alpha/beta fold hydrolase n=1 Tax=Cellulomonas fengjieae TaxID=2819978 RepID=UPI001AAE60BD|nr:alpha/beta hydrolase [Cellulomonas fengjieae]MBO3101876.1 alpha/beta fold hydrolase [Cellulomonas fengjieae]
MQTLISADGTPIAYERTGDGPAVVLTTGAFNDHTTGAELAALLDEDHTAVTYDRRARGRSGDTAPYAVERELEDLAAVIEVAGGSAAVFGFSSGGVLALAAAAAGLPITHLALYEAPFALGTLPARPADLPARLTALIADGRPGDAVALFQTEGIGLPPTVVEQLRDSSAWPALVAIAQSTVYDATLTSTLGVPTPAMRAVDVPTVVLTGAQTWPGLAESAAALAAMLPRGRHVVVPGGADHGIPAESTAAAVRDLLASSPPVRDVHHQS